jgi:23S rRNA (guanosine2251-2'-O)-methyltransferase
MKKLSMDELNRLSVNAFQATAKVPVVVVLDNIRSCHNIGSIFRTSDAMLIRKLFLCGITATPPNKEIHKSALDAEKSVDWEYAAHTEDVVNRLKQDGYRIYAVEQVSNSTLLPDFKPTPEEKMALVFGNEVHGVQQGVIDLCHGALEIPQFGTKHSFNVSVSAGIVLWEVTRKLIPS